MKYVVYDATKVPHWIKVQLSRLHFRHGSIYGDFLEICAANKSKPYYGLAKYVSNAIVRVALDGDIVTGWSLTYFKKTEPLRPRFQVYVMRKYRKLGIGSALFKKSQPKLKFIPHDHTSNRFFGKMVGKPNKFLGNRFNLGYKS